MSEKYSQWIKQTQKQIITLKIEKQKHPEKETLYKKRITLLENALQNLTKAGQM